MIRRVSAIVFGDQSLATDATANHRSISSPNVASVATPSFLRYEGGERLLGHTFATLYRLGLVAVAPGHRITPCEGPQFPRALSRCRMCPRTAPTLRRATDNQCNQ